ncbi:MAG TPA: ABC transporter substrate-binding protein, partial [Stellaceae bacterium]|nr:ABC transporter substrate-binding protein [Stellaceae bacterium]
MPLRSSVAARIAILAPVLLGLLFGTPSAWAAEFVDAALRHVRLSDTITRVMAADQAAAVLVYVLAPDKLVGWSRPISYAQRRWLPAKAPRLPTVGQLLGRTPQGEAEIVARWRPDLVVYYGPVSPAATAFAERLQRQTGVPTIVLDGRIGQSFEALRLLGTVLGVAARGDTLGLYAEHAIDSIRGTLLIQPPSKRPLVYYGLGYDGLETGLKGAVVMADIDEAGAINVAGSLGSGGLTRVTPAEIRFWNPDFIIAERPGFYNALLRNRRWRTLAAVRNKRVFLAPPAPFGWISGPPSVNRLIGLYWLSSLFYKGVAQPDLRPLAAEFYQTFYNVKLTDRQLDALLRAAEPPAPKPTRALAPSAPAPLVPTP